MAYKPHRGTYEIDRIFPSIGRVRIRTGTKDKRLADRYELMLESLPLEVVRLIGDGKIPIRTAYDAWSTGQASTLPNAQSVRPLVETMREWIDENHVSDSHGRARESVLARLQGVATIGDLPATVRTWRCEYHDRGPTFNRMRASVMAFLRDTVGKRHTLYLDIAAIDTLPEPRVMEHHPCTVQEAKDVRDSLGKKWGPAWWVMCCHGMGPKEYWRDGWEKRGDTLVIHGQKRIGRERVVPLVCDVRPAPGMEGGFAEALERGELGVTPYDARRTYGRWLDEVRVTKYQHDALMGHGERDMRSLYTSGDISAWLPEIRRLLVAHVADAARLRIAR